MSQYILLNRIKVQGANAIAGFTWGFPAITHFLGFVHNLSRRLSTRHEWKDIRLDGCMVVSHRHQVHTYQYNQFIQSKNPPYRYKEEQKNKVGSPPIIEEGKMDMVVSLLIPYDGNIGDDDALITILENHCMTQRLAGGTIQEIKNIEFFNLDSDNGRLKTLKRKLLPGFVLLDRSDYLQEHFKNLKKKDNNVEIFDAWMDFIALKSKARPKYDIIQKHLKKLTTADLALYDLWIKHLDKPYTPDNIPQELKEYFSSLPENKNSKGLLAQWKSYCNPDNRTDAEWEYIPKPHKGFLVPIMTGYKAISKVYKNHEIPGTRDNETDVCFVEAIHTIGEWVGAHKFRTGSDIADAIWYYSHEPDWYLCKQNTIMSDSDTQERVLSPEDDF